MTTDEFDEERKAEKRRHLLARTEEVLRDQPDNSIPVQEHQERGRENRERRRELARQSRLRKWDERVPSRFKDAQLANIDHARIRSFATEWLADPTRNLLILGPESGIGKTFTARAIARELFAEGHSVEFWQLGQLFDALRPGQDDNQVWPNVRGSEYLALDDLGAERVTEWAEERLHTLLHHRDEWALPVLITSNLTTEDLYTYLGQRLASRLLGGAATLMLKGRDRRFDD